MTTTLCDICRKPNAEKVNLQFNKIQENRMRQISSRDLCPHCVKHIVNFMSSNYGKTFDSEPPK